MTHRQGKDVPVKYTTGKVIQHDGRERTHAGEFQQETERDLGARVIKSVPCK